MEEYEVDLRDYLRVLWRGKWIVLVTFLVAVGAAAVVNFRAPDIYRAEATLALETPGGMPATYSLPSLDFLLQRVKDPSLLNRAVSGAGADALSGAWLAGHLQAKKQGKFLELVLEASFSPDILRSLLAGVVAALDEEAKAGVGQAVEERLSSLSAQREELQRQYTQWEQELSDARARAEAQRAALLEAIAEIEGDPEFLSLSLGDTMTVQGYLVRERLDLLYTRLQAVELALDEMDRFGVRALPGIGGTLITLEGKLASLEVEEATLKELLSHPPSPLLVIRGPRASSTPVGPNRGMNLAVAGVLGLFFGVLLAFFWHWLREPPGEQAAPQGD